MITEADTCRQYVLPNLYAARWTDELIREQKTFTDGRILVQGRSAKRGRQKRVDSLLYSRRDFPIAVVEAKSAYLDPGQGLQQAIGDAVVLDLQRVRLSNAQANATRTLTNSTASELNALPSAILAQAFTGAL